MMPLLLTLCLVVIVAAKAQACADPQRTKALLERLAAKANAQVNFGNFGAEPVTRIGHGGHATAKIAYRLPAVSECRAGRADIFPCAGVSLLGHLTLADIGGGVGSDSWGWRDPQTGRYYALVGRSNGTAFVDVSDPTAPVYLGNLPTETAASDWRDIKTYRHYALIVADELTGHGMQVFDLTRLRGLEAAAAPQTFSADVVYHGFDDAHNLVVNEDSGFAYAVGGKSCEGGPHMVNLAEPLRPVFAGCFRDDGYTHDAQCVIYRGPDRDYAGREVCFASNEDHITLIDVSDKASPSVISRSSYADVGYTHQGWLTADQRYFLVDDELDETELKSNTRTLVWDMLDLDRPRLVGVHDGGGRAVDHNQYIVGNYVYQAHFSRGLRVLKIEDLAAARLREVAYFDSHPERDGYGYQGAWNVYPFFANGVVLINDVNRGLFIVRPQLAGEPEDRDFQDGFEAREGAKRAR